MNANLSNLVGSQGGCPEVAGWKIGYPTPAAKRRLELMISGRAAQEMEETLREMSPETAARYKATFIATAGTTFKTFAEGWVTAVTSDDGAALFLLSLLREHHPDATFADAVALAENHSVQLETAMLEVLPPFFDLLANDPKVPKAKRPELKKQLEKVFQQSLARRRNKPAEQTETAEPPEPTTAE